MCLYFSLKIYVLISIDIDGIFNVSLKQRPFLGRTSLYGWISTLKDTFGFIEDVEHNAEIFFHYSELQAPIEKYRTGLPVSYSLGIKGNFHKENYLIYDTFSKVLGLFFKF